MDHQRLWYLAIEKRLQFTAEGGVEPLQLRWTKVESVIGIRFEKGSGKDIMPVQRTAFCRVLVTFSGAA